MSRARQTPAPTPTQPSHQPSGPPGDTESMDIVAQAMASMTPRPAPQGQEFPPGNTFANNGVSAFHAPGSTFPQGVLQPHPYSASTSGQGTSGSPSFAGLDDAFQRLTLKPKEYVCEFYDQEVVHRKGVLLQYINSNSTGGATAIGVTRIGVVDPRKVPLYLSRNISIIRQHAAAALQNHMRLTLCSAGALEKLGPDDFSISFSWASLTEAGRNLNPLGRSDIALGYAGFEGIVTPIFLTRSDPFPTYIVNVFVYLQDATRRSSAVIAKAREDAIAKTHPERPVYVKKYPPAGYTDKDLKIVASHAAEQTAARVSADNMKRAAVAPVTYDQCFPPLPEGASPGWNLSGRTMLPDE